MRKSFTRLFGFLLLSVMMLFSYGLYAQEAQSTVELKAGSVNACYNASDSYTAKISVRDFIKIKSFWVTLKFDPTKFQVKGLDVLDSQLSPLWPSSTWDNVNGTISFGWSGAEATIGDDVLTDIIGIRLGVTGFPNNSGTNVFASALTVTTAQFWYANVGLGTDEIRTTSISNGTLTATVAYPTVNYAVTSATCDGGQANITVTSPVGAGFYYYFNGSTTSSTSPVATAQAPSTNYVRVVDSNGCSSHLTTIPVTAPTPLVINSVTTEPAKCYGSNGEIQISAAGGTGPYTYYVVPDAEMWSFQYELMYGDGKISPELNQYKYTTFQVLRPAGNYWVTVDGSNGCNNLRWQNWWGQPWANPAWQQITVDQPESAVAFGTSVIGNTCNGASAGVITVSNPNGGSGEGYQVTKDGGLHWYDFEEGSYIFDSLIAGTYTITVKDSNGCSTTSAVAVTQPASIAFTLAYGDATCAGGATGSVTITSVSGGTAPYTYAVVLTTAGFTGATWSSTTVQTLGLTANYYSVKVKDANGCEKAFANQDGSGNILPIQAPGALAFATSADNVAALEVVCNGGSYTLTVTATGGIKPYTYSFNGGATTTSTTYALAGLLADTPVTVTVTDANSCSVSKLVNIDVADAMLAAIASDPAVISPTCPGGNDGRVTVLASGGTAPYTYYTDALLKVPFTNNVLAIPEGTTTITVKDANGCAAQISVSADYLIASTLTATVTNIDCHGSKTGKIDVVTTWQAGRTVKFFVSANQADVFTSGTLFNPTTINTVANTSTPTTFVAGTYYLGAKDEMGCTSNVVKVVITENAALAMTAVSTPATCSGLFDGTLTINTTGGFGHPSYAIANNIEAFSSSSIVFQPVGTWSATTSIGKQVVQVQRGTYYVKIKDDCTGSTVAGPFFVDGYKAISFTGTIPSKNITCHNANNGTITVPLANVSGGKPGFEKDKNLPVSNYIFTLIKPIGSVPATATNTTGAFTDLAEGTYTVTITDVTNCPLYTSSAITITNPPVIAISNVAVSHFTCKDSRDGRITISAVGGTPGYYLAVNAVTPGTPITAENPNWISFGSVTSTTSKAYIATEPGLYYLYIKDANGCIGNTVTVTVQEPAVLVPVVGTLTNVTCTSAGSAQINVTGGWAATLTPTVQTYNYVLTGTSTGTNTTGLFSGLAVGSYTVNVQTTNAPASTTSGIVTYTYPVSTSVCKYPVSFTVTGPTPYTYKASVENVKCKGGNDGSLTVTVLSGTAATVTTTGPEYYVQLTTTTNPALSSTGWVRTTNQKYKFASLNHAIYSVWIGNKADGSDCVIAGGTSTPTADGVFNRSASWEVNEPATALTASAVWVKDVTCFGGSDGKFTITAAGGTVSYTYAALPSYVDAGHIRVPEATEYQVSNAFEKPIGTYVIWVKDANGCTVGGEGTIENPIDEYRVQLRQPLQVAFSTSLVNATCYGIADGKITVSNITSAGAPFTWTVTGVDYAGNAVNMSSTTTATTSFIINNVPASETVGSTTTKTYSVTLTDKNGCSRTLALAGPIYQNKMLTVDIVKADGAFVCPGDNNGTIEANAAGGTGSYTYRLWKDGSPYTLWVDLPSFLVEVGHTWKVEVKDAPNGCIATDEEVINAPIGVSATLTETTCYGDAKASVIVHATGEAGRKFYVRYKINTGTYGAWIELNQTIKSLDNSLAIGDLLFANVTETENFYYFQLKDDKGCLTPEIRKPFVPTQHPLQVTATVTDLKASVVITGGISPYTYSVGTSTVTLATNGDTFQTVNLPAGQNTITVYDAHGCSYGVAAVVAPLTVTAEPATGNAMKNSFDVKLTFNREVTGVASATTVAGGTISSVTGTGKVYTVTVVGADLATVTLTVGNAVKDVAGSTLSPSAVFTYVVGDNTAPKLVSWTPNNTTLKDNHPTFVLTFDENIAVGSGNIKVYKKSGDALALTIPVTGAAVSGKTATVTYVYDATKGGLDKNTDYYVFLDAGAFKDVAGNASGAVATSTAWTFKTGDFATVVVDPNASVFKVYPNPFVDYVTVTNASELSKVVVSNIAGQVVKEVVYPDGTIQLNELRSGVYFITLYQDNEVVSTVKLLKR